MRAVIGHHHWGRPGGGQLVVAAAAYALSKQREVTLAGIAKFDPAKYLEWFGIDLRDFDIVSLPIALSAFGLYSRLLVWYPTEKAIRCDTDVVFLDEYNYKPLMRKKNVAKFKLMEYIHFPIERSVGLNRESDPYVTERYSHFPLNTYWEMYLKLLKTVVRKNPFQSADTVLTNSKWTASIVRDSYGEFPIVLNPPIPPNVVPNAEIPAFDERMNNVVMVGRFTEEKRYEWVIENIVPKVRGTLKIFFFGGAGTPVSLHYKSRLISLAARAGSKVSDGIENPGDVYFISDAPRDLINSTIDKSKVFLHSTINEHWGISVCLPPNTLVSTGASLLPIKKICENQIVQTHLGVEGMVKRTFERSYSGQVISLCPSGLNIPFTLTPEHPVLCIRRRLAKFRASIEKLLPEWVPANEIKKGDILCYPINRQIKPLDSFDITKHLDMEWKNKRGVGISFNHNEVWYSYAHKNPHKIPRHLNLNSDLLWLIGFYTAEGSSNGNYDRCEFASEPELIEKAKIISETIFHVPSEIAHRLNRLPNGSQIHGNILRLSCRILGALFSNLCGTGARNKRFPDFIMDIDPKEQLEMLQGFWDGDGSKTVDTINGYECTRYHTSSRVLVHQIKEILLRNNKIPSIVYNRFNGVYTIATTSGIERRYLRRRSLIKGNYFYVPVSRVERSDYSGMVYNLEVEGANSYTLESGTVHNCEAMARGLPIIVHKSGGAWSDLAEEGSSGIGYESAEEAIESIMLLCRDQNKWSYFQKKGLERTRELSLENFSERLNQLAK